MTFRIVWVGLASAFVAGTVACATPSGEARLSQREAAEAERAAKASAEEASEWEGKAKAAARESEAATAQAKADAKRAKVAAGRAEQATAASDPCPLEPPTSHTIGYNFTKGTLERSRCVTDHVRQDLAYSRVTPAGIRLRAAQLVTLYQARSARQQIWIDATGLGTGIFSLASIAEAGAGTTTLSYLGGAALTPVILAQFNAYEPKRDVYYAGSLGLMMLSTRYEGFGDALGRFDRYQNGDIRGALDAAKQACLGLPAHVTALQAGLVDRGDTGAFLAELKAVSTACDQLLVDQGAMRAYRGGLEVWKPKLQDFYARDVLVLDAMLLQRDQDLRSTPLEILSGIAASPFNVASTLLTGEDGQKAIGKIKALDAIASLDMRATPLRVPPLPKFKFTATADLALPSLDKLAPKLREMTKPKAEKADPDPDLKPDLDAVRSLLVAVNAAKPVMDYQQTLAMEVGAIAGADQLKFWYDATNRKVQVALTAPEKAGTTPDKPAAPGSAN